MEEITITSPDKRKEICLTYDGEARFGPAFFLGSSSGFEWPLGSSTLGEDVHWSSDSRYAVVLVFRSRDTSRSPNVDLVAVDTTRGTVQTIDHNSRGLIQQQGFLPSGEYEYRRVDSGVATIKRWHP